MTETEVQAEVCRLTKTPIWSPAKLPYLATPAAWLEPVIPFQVGIPPQAETALPVPLVQPFPWVPPMLLFMPNGSAEHPRQDQCQSPPRAFTLFAFNQYIQPKCYRQCRYNDIRCIQRCRLHKCFLDSIGTAGRQLVYHYIRSQRNRFRNNNMRLYRQSQHCCRPNRIYRDSSQ